MKKLTNILLLSSIVLGGISIGASSVSANDLGWVPGQQDPEPGQTIKGEENAEVAVNGWVG